MKKNVSQFIMPFSLRKTEFTKAEPKTMAYPAFAQKAAVGCQLVNIVELQRFEQT